MTVFLLYIEWYKNKSIKDHRKKTMHTFKKIIFFLGSNIIGFSLLPILYVTSVVTGILDINGENFDTANFFLSTAEIVGRDPMPVPIMLSFPSFTWAICALFSFAYFFVNKRWQRFFLLAPLVLPVTHALVILLQFA